MTKRGQPHSWIYCSVCTRKMGSVPGTKVVTGMICDDPICQYQGEPDINAQRDSYLVAGFLSKIGVGQMAFSEGISRQRVYQIIDNWKRGV